MNDAVELPALAAQLNIDVPAAGSSQEAEMQLYLDAAVRYVEHDCGPLVATGTRTYKAYPSGDYLVLSATHLTAVTAVRDPYGQVATVDARDVNLLAGIVKVPAAAAGPWEVDAAVGPAAVEPDLKLAALIIAAHLWETQRGRTARPGFLRGRTEEDPIPAGFLVPHRAAALMQASRRPATIA